MTMKTDTNAPDAALLWARERLVERHTGLPHLQKRIAIGAELGGLAEHMAEAFRAGQAHERRADAGLLAALERQADNMAFVLNNMAAPDRWYDKFTRELAEDRAAIAAAKGE